MNDTRITKDDILSGKMSKGDIKKLLLSVVEEIPPCKWPKRNLTVVGDGYLLACGTRVHVVEEPVSPDEIVMIDNAFVINWER